MRTIEFRPAHPVDSQDPEQGKVEIQLFDAPAKQIRDRAFAKTEVLMGILERQEASCWHHGGLNE